MTQEFLPAIEGLKIYPDGRMSAADAAAYLGFGYKTLANQRGAGIGPPFYKTGRYVFYRRADLDQWLESCRTTSTTGFRRRQALRGAA